MSERALFETADSVRLRAEGVQAALDILTDFAGAPGLYPTPGGDHEVSASGARRALDILIGRVTEVRDQMLHPERYEGGEDA